MYILMIGGKQNSLPFSQILSPPPPYPLSLRSAMTNCLSTAGGLAVKFSHLTPLSAPRFPTSVVRCSVSSPEKRAKAAKGRGRKKKGTSTGEENSSVSSAERDLRLVFMDELMLRARARDAVGVSDVIYDMVAAGLSPGPRSFHGLVVAYALGGDQEGAVSS